jgi:hypothetical protein
MRTKQKKERGNYHKYLYVQPAVSETFNKSKKLSKSKVVNHNKITAPWITGIISVYCIFKLHE